jgi:tetratricopeptide (TPR) repeat protein
MFLDLTDRNILPRWRDFHTTAALGELDSAPAVELTTFDSDFLAQRIQEFSLHQVPWVASDLLSAAFVVGRPEQAAEAAKFILANQSICPPGAVGLARKVLNPESADWTVPDLEDEDAVIRGRIHTTRIRLREEPRNAIQWVELSRLYTIAGEPEAAEKAMRLACALSPYNRFVLRSAARLFTHNRAPQSALRILRGAASIKKDPWLLAAEVGVSCVAGISPRFVKSGFALVEAQSLPPFSITELASSLGTLEMREGATKKAKKYFRRSLISPTENSVAQAEWASKGLAGLEVDVQAYDVPRPFEAQALDRFSKGEWEESIQWSRKWHLDQPFSSRPAILASYVNSCMLERHEESVQLIKKSLITNPGDPPLLNNLAFALASMGNVEEAERVISSVETGRVSDPSRVTLTATLGLIYFRKGMTERGRELYLDAMEQAKKKGILNYRAMAAAYLAREEFLADTGSGEVALKRAADEAHGQQDLGVIEILNRVSKLLEERNLKPPGSTTNK